MREHFAYCPKLGGLTDKAKTRLVGKRTQRYVQVRLPGGVYVVAHRVVWLLKKGVWHLGDLDHRDGDGFNNRIGNLRAGDTALNAQNQRRAKASNKLGVLGVSAHRRKFRAVIMVRGARHDLGLHDTADLAHQAYVKAKRKLHAFGTL